MVAAFPAMSNTTNTPNTGDRLTRLRFTLNALHGFAVSEGGPANPMSATAADLAALVAVLDAAADELPAAANVPEWDNHSDDDGHPGRLGGVACTYAAWIEEGEDEPVAEHDGANQLAEIAKALGNTLDALDALAFDGEGMPL
jgi:hypothetical protein